MIVDNYIGCDVSKDTLDFFDPAQGQHCRIANRPAAVAAHISTLQPGRDFVVMEATGVYDRVLRHALADAGLRFARCNPQHTHHHARSGVRRAKTDRLDAAMLAEYGASRRPAAAAKPDEKIERLQSLARRRDQLVEIRAKQKVLLHDAFDPDVATDVKALMDHLDERIDRLQAIIDAAVRESEGTRRLWRLLTSAPGVSTVTALTLIAHMPELGNRSPKTIAALAGLAPFDSESGKTRRRAAIAPGRTRIRRAMYMAALGAIRACTRFKTAYDAIAARSGSRKLAIIAIARKLLVALNAMIRDQKSFA
jgi:transposase